MTERKPSLWVIVGWYLAFVGGIVGIAVLCGLLFVGCGLGALHGATIDLGKPQTPLPLPAITRMLVPVHDADGNNPTNLVGTLQVWGVDGTIAGVNLSTGVSFAPVPLGVGSTVCFTADDLAQTCEDRTTAAQVDAVVMRQPHADPSTVPLAELAAIRGAMWSARLDLPYGPRPGQPDNILATDFLAAYTPADKLRAITAYKARGYTHVVVGPMVDIDGAGFNQQPIADGSGLFRSLRRRPTGISAQAYHQQYPDQDWRGANFERFLDLLQLFWDAGLKPIVFIHPDNWTFEQTAELTPLFQSPRAQRLIRIVVPAGWEPFGYNASSCTWARYMRWARETLPNALVLIHTISDIDAPVGTDDLCNDDDKVWNPGGNAAGWARVAPYVHGWLIQNGPYPAAPAHDPEHKQPFCDQFRPDAAGSLWQRFHQGYAGWPTFSAWGPDQPMRIYNAENTAYESYWHNLPEDASRDWGDLAISCGSDGYLDGGRVPVPVR